MDQRRFVRASAARFDSDADALPFPRGGVFAVDAPCSDPGAHAPVLAAPRAISSQIDATLDLLQAQLDELTTQVDEAYPINPSTRSPWRPSAA